MSDFNRGIQKNNPVWNAQARQSVVTFGGTGKIMLNESADDLRSDTNYMILYNSGANSITLKQAVNDGAGGYTVAANGIVVVPGAAFEMAVNYGYRSDGTAGTGRGIEVFGTNGQTFVGTYFTS
tara:strand:+ start:11140 stop:11511 length:372 start_codon:yes stop_codon:yes gene_type:complete